MRHYQLEKIKNCFNNGGLIKYVNVKDHNKLKYNIVNIKETDMGTLAFIDDDHYINLEYGEFLSFILFDKNDKQIKKSEKINERDRFFKNRNGKFLLLY